MINNMHVNQEALDLIPLRKWNEWYPYPTVSALYQYSYRNTDNFNQVVIRKIGGRNYIKVSAFKQWVEDTNK